MPTTLTVITLIAYLAAFNLLVFSIYRNSTTLKRGSSLIWGMAILMHALLLSSTLFHENALNLSFYNAISTVTWLVSTLLYVATFSRPVQSLGLVVLPLVSIGLILGMIFPEMTKYVFRSRLQPIGNLAHAGCFHFSQELFVDQIRAGFQPDFSLDILAQNLFH